MQELGATQYFNSLFDSPDSFPQAYSYDCLQSKATWSFGERAHWGSTFIQSLSFILSLSLQPAFLQKHILSRDLILTVVKYKGFLRQKPWILFYA